MLETIFFLKLVFTELQDFVVDFCFSSVKSLQEYDRNLKHEMLCQLKELYPEVFMFVVFLEKI